MVISQYIRLCPASRLALESYCLFLAGFEEASCHESYCHKELNAPDNCEN